MSTQFAEDNPFIRSGTSVAGSAARHSDEIGTELSADDEVDDKVDRRVNRHQDIAPIRQVPTIDFQTVLELIKAQLQTQYVSK